MGVIVAAAAAISNGGRSISIGADGLATLPPIVSVGNVPENDVSLFCAPIAADFGALADQYGGYFAPQFNSSATNSGTALYVLVKLPNVAFTQTSTWGVYIENAVKAGGAATITTQYGLYIAALSSGQANWSIYCLSGNVTFRTSAIATNATTGHLFIPSSAGAPTGVPASIPTGQIALQYDSTNNFLYVYSGGWKKSTVYA